MKNRFLFVILFLFSFHLLSAQPRVHEHTLQGGLCGGLNVTFFHKSASEYNDESYSSRPAPGIALSLPVFVALGKNLSLRTGLGLQVKQYEFDQGDLGFPDLHGLVYIRTRFNTLELPLLISAGKQSGKHALEYTAGVVLAYNMPTQYTVGYHIVGAGFSLSVQSPNPDFEKTFSPDLYGGISLVRYDGDRRSRQFTLSYQYGLLPTARFEFSSTTQHNSDTRTFHAVVKPTLSCLTLTYTYFPTWLGPFKKQKA